MKAKKVNESLNESMLHTDVRDYAASNLRNLHVTDKTRFSRLVYDVLDELGYPKNLKTHTIAKDIIAQYVDIDFEDDYNGDDIYREQSWGH